MEYNLGLCPSVQLPETAAHLGNAIEQHLRYPDTGGPWGFIDEEWFFLKLEKQPFSSTGKLLLFSIDFISEKLTELFPTGHISKAERRMLLQSLAGIPLKKAAEFDNVSYETKKSQLKSVFQKTQLNSQQALSTFLITHFTLELASKFSRISDNAESDDSFFHYVDTYMGSYVRASVVQESADKRFRIIELGDPAGMPVVCVHHLGIVSFSEAEIDFFRRNQIRLICPLRHGALGPEDRKMTSAEHVEHAIAGIDLAISLTGQRTATVLGLLSGCLYAINYLKHYPERANRLIMLGASYKPPVEIEVTSKFKKNLHDLATDSEQTLELAISIMLESIDQPEKLKSVISESNNNGEADNQTIDELFSDESQVLAMQHRLRYSPLSIVQDLKAQAAKDWTPLQRISSDTEIHFIHGTDDTLVPIDNVKTLMKHHSGSQLHVIEGAGNWIFGRYTRQTASIIRKILQSSS